jgi:hypothetical protein
LWHSIEIHIFDVDFPVVPKANQLLGLRVGIEKLCHVREDFESESDCKGLLKL